MNYFLITIIIIIIYTASYGANLTTTYGSEDTTSPTGKFEPDFTIQSTSYVNKSSIAILFISSIPIVEKAVEFARKGLLDSPS